MSGILNKNKIIKLLILMIFFAVEVMASVQKQEFMYFSLAMDFVLICIFYINRAVRKIMFKQVEPFSSHSRIRNVDCLVIGEICNPQEIIPDDCNTYVQINIPNSSLFSCYEILKHTSSIVKEQGGDILFVIGKKHAKHKFSVFDTYFLHEITVKKYGLSWLKKKSKIPFIFCPIDSMKLLFNQKKSVLEEITLCDDEIADYCHEREYRLKIYRC
jgi:hypothetical protein